MSFNSYLDISESLFSNEQTSNDDWMFRIEMLNKFTRYVLKFNTHI